MIYIASDHAGFDLKNTVKEYLITKGYEVKDMGPVTLDNTDDYPDYVIPLAKEVSKNIENKGIVICRNGVGVSITANRFKKVRAALSWNEEHAKTARYDDDTNVLALPADYIDRPTALDIVNTWLKTDFSGLPRHIRRIKKIDSI